MIKSAYVMGVVQNHFYHSVKEIAPRKNDFFGKINLLWNSGHLDKNNDVKHNIFRCLINTADMDDFGMTYGNFMNALEM